MNNKTSPIENLPNELILAIATSTNDLESINALTQTNQRFHQTLNAFLYRQDAFENDMSAIDWAVESGSVPTAQMSMDASIGYDRQMHNIQQALYDAAQTNQLDIVACLLQKEGVDPNIASREHPFTPLNAAIRYGYTAIVKLMLAQRNTDLNGEMPSGDWPPNRNDLPLASPLSVAAYSCRLEIIELLLQVPGLDTHYRDYSNGTPLYYAVQTGDPEPVARLLRHGDIYKDVNVAYRKDRGLNRPYVSTTPLITAAGFTTADIVNLLVAVPGIDLDLGTNEKNKTAMHVAASLGSDDIVRSLLDYGADPDPKDNANETPLFLAAKNGFMTTVKMLIEAGADVNHVCDNGVHPLGAARTEGHVEVVRVLREFGRLDERSLGSVPRNWNAARGTRWSARARNRVGQGTET